MAEKDTYAKQPKDQWTQHYLRDVALRDGAADIQYEGILYSTE